MNRMTRIFTLTAFSIFVARAAEPAQTVSTIGPVELCESQALTQTFFNPNDFTIDVQVGLIHKIPGRLKWEDIVLKVLPGRGESVVYQQGRVSTDADLNQMPDTCRTPTTISVVVTANGDFKSSRVRGFDKSHRHARRIVFGTFSPRSDSRAVSEPFHIEAGEVTARLMNIGPVGGAYTVEVADAITGLIVAAKTVYLDPGPDQQQPGSNASAEFTFQNEEAGARVAFIKRVSPDTIDPASVAEPPAVAISFQTDSSSGDNDIGVEEIVITHEGMYRET